mmetsp:Transcript_11920/g.35812  ORF Transcript_11920/g.35812 Transcript_11920/m.35812 type:complete len:277 (+) Transcript_11920:94-924(+)|eukprot:CAMPEP_0198653546 /NCGR_PEP_ID=MMETSP1467-20131203/7122_1 /TAXON_ID=1462469 /ORGANISM="unid. sp., Strain CCMP2135" /LENGTH=276 /DNA_ID=CAMNT_0044389513 /DNA_START=32 /DNA_END=862 /DNA_ORIENTATION=+
MRAFCLAVLAFASASDISRDVAYLHSIAAVHEFCAEDFERFCDGRRRLSEEDKEVLISVTAFVETQDDDVDHSTLRTPLGLGRADACLRKNYYRLSTACATSIAVVDDTEAPPPPPRFCAFFWWVLLLVLPLCCVARRTRKLKELRSFVEAIRNDEKLLPLVEKTAGPLPAPRKVRCCRALWMGLAALVAGYALTLLLGPALALLFVWAVVVPGALVNHCLLKRSKGESQVAGDESTYVPPPIAPASSDDLKDKDEENSAAAEDDAISTTTTKLLI